MPHNGLYLNGISSKGEQQMAKILVALSLVCYLSTIAFAETCKRCGYVKKHTHYPPYSNQLSEVIAIAMKKTKIDVGKDGSQLIHKIIWKEDRSGNLKAYNKGCYGLGQGKKSTYLNSGIPWKTTCPVEQVMMILIYTKGRYKTLDKAWEHHRRYNWY